MWERGRTRDPLHPLRRGRYAHGLPRGRDRDLPPALCRAGPRHRRAGAGRPLGKVLALLERARPGPTRARGRAADLPRAQSPGCRGPVRLRPGEVRPGRVPCGARPPVCRAHGRGRHALRRRAARAARPARPVCALRGLQRPDRESAPPPAEPGGPARPRLPLRGDGPGQARPRLLRPCRPRRGRAPRRVPHGRGFARQRHRRGRLRRHAHLLAQPRRPRALRRDPAGERDPLAARTRQPAPSFGFQKNGGTCHDRL